MKRKLLAIVVTIISIGLMACGSNSSDLTDKAESTQIPSEQEILSEDNVQNTEISEEADKEIEENGDIEINSQEDIVPTWYLDSEGVKNEELGVVIRKDNIELKELGLVENVGIFTPNESGDGGRRDQCVFRCNYYEGSLDTYISEHPCEYYDNESGEWVTLTMEKGKIRDINYAYGEDSFGKTIAFVGNGIVVSASLEIENESVDDYLNRIDLVKYDNESSKDCMAYIADDGLHCPALGIKLSCDGGENVVNSVAVSCLWANYSSMTIRDESITNMGTMYYMADAKNAQEVVDKYVEGAIEPNEYQTITYSAIEGTVEINIGKCKYLGRGVIGQYDWSNDKQEDWLFYSDDTTWSISVGDEEGGKYEDYINIIEELK